MKRHIQQLSNDEINSLLNSFNSDKEPKERYASFDYCFNYFQNFKDKTDIAKSDNIQNSCLQLGFYLASWGMYRGSTFLLQKSFKIFEPLIKYIGSKECNVWGIDVDKYEDADNISKLILCGKRIKQELGVHGKSKKEATDTLVTKIMLGIFGNVPAFDAYFKKGSDLGNFNIKSLSEISDFYKSHSQIVLKESIETKTFEYLSGLKSNRTYTQAKIIDMIFFTKGLKESKK